MAGSVAFLLDVLLLGVSYFLHLVGVELEEVGDAGGVSKNSPLTFRTSFSNILTDIEAMVLGRVTTRQFPARTSMLLISKE